MRTQKDAEALVGRAGRATTAIQQHSLRAIRALERGLVYHSAAVNAIGVLMEPRLRIEDLLTARAEIDAALESLRTATWPQDSDYRESGLS